MEVATLRHGYTIADLRELTRCAVGAAPARAFAVEDRWDTAYGAIAEHLYSTPAEPSRAALIAAGCTAITGEWRQAQQAHGVNRRDSYSGFGSSRRFNTYWFTPPHSVEDTVVDRVATRQVLSTLSGKLRDALVAVVTTADYQEAAETLGIRYEAAVARMGLVRRHFTRQFLGDEIPVRADSAAGCRRGHSRKEHGAVDSRGRRWCRECKRMRERKGWRR